MMLGRVWGETLRRHLAGRRQRVGDRHDEIAIQSRRAIAPRGRLRYTVSRALGLPHATAKGTQQWHVSPFPVIFTSALAR